MKTIAHRITLEPTSVVFYYEFLFLPNENGIHTLDFPYQSANVVGYNISLKQSLHVKIKQIVNRTQITFSTPTLADKQIVSLRITTPLSQFRWKSKIYSIDWSGTPINEIIDKNNLLFTISQPVKGFQVRGTRRYKIIQPNQIIFSFSNKNQHVHIEIGKEIKYIIEIKGNVHTSTSLEEATIKILGLKNSNYQNVKVLDHSPGMKITHDQNQNIIHYWSQKLSAGNHSFFVTYEVNRKPSFVKYAQLGDISQFDYAPRHLIAETSIWNAIPSLKRFVRKIAENSNDIYEIIFKIAHLILNKVKYKISPGRTPASVVWKRGYGDCSEYSDLMIALLRQAGVPCALATGWVVKEDNSLNGHAWIEFYTPKGKYIPIDPTWGYINGISASHILQSNEYLQHDNKVIKINYSYNGDKPHISLQYSKKIREIIS